MSCTNCRTALRTVLAPPIHPPCSLELKCSTVNTPLPSVRLLPGPLQLGAMSFAKAAAAALLLAVPVCAQPPVCRALCRFHELLAFAAGYAASAACAGPRRRICFCQPRTARARLCRLRAGLEHPCVHVGSARALPPTAPSRDVQRARTPVACRAGRAGAELCPKSELARLICSVVPANARHH